MLCNNCGTNVEDGIIFCPNCGNKMGNSPKMPDMPGMENNAAPGQENENAEEGRIEAVQISPTGIVETNSAVPFTEQYAPKKFCPNCGMANNMNDMRCQNCGFFFGNAEPNMGPSMGPNMGKPTKKGAKALKIAVPIVIAVVFIALLCVFVPRLLKGVGGKENEHDFLLYIKDNELMMAKSGEYTPVQIGEKYYEDEDDADIYTYNSGGVSYSPDNKYIYYPHAYDTYESVYDLYRKNLNDKKAEEEKIDSNVVYYEVVDNDKILYIKDWDDRKVYLYDKDEKIKVTSDALWAHVSDDGQYIIWETNDDDGRLYVQDIAMKEDKIKLESDIYTVYAYSSDLNVIIYDKDDNLYILKDLEDREKIASDVEYAYVYGSNDNLQIYYTKEGDEIELTVYDLIDDDCLSEDEDMVEPRISDYQTTTYVDDFFGSREKIETDDAYYDALEEYSQKEDRDYIREYLKSVDLTDSATEIYYYDAKSNESSKIMDTIVLDEDSLLEDTALMYCWSVDVENVKNAPKLSELTDMTAYEVEAEAADALFNSMQVWYIKDGEVVEIPNVEMDYENINSLSVVANENNHMIYLMYEYYTEDLEDYYTELYSCDYNAEEAALELVNDEAFFIIDWFADDIYYTNEDDDFYRGDTKIDEDVYAYSVNVQEDGTVLYLTDIDEDEVEGTLKMYQDGETVEIAENVPVLGYRIFEGNKIAFLEDYNFDKSRGDLNVYDGKEVINVDSDVASVIDY